MKSILNSVSSFQPGSGDRPGSGGGSKRKIHAYAKIDIEEIGEGPVMLVKGERGRKSMFGGKNEKKGKKYKVRVRGEALFHMSRINDLRNTGNIMANSSMLIAHCSLLTAPPLLVTEGQE